MLFYNEPRDEKKERSVCSESWAHVKNGSKGNSMHKNIPIALTILNRNVLSSVRAETELAKPAEKKKELFAEMDMEWRGR